MLKLVAAAPDGWGIALEGESYWLIRPPFRQRDRSQVTSAQVERALVEEDFVLEEEPLPFAGWGELSRHLQALVISQASKEERAAAQDAARRILKRATAEQARRHLDQIQGRLDKGHTRGVESVLIALLGAEAVSHEAELVTEIQRLLTEVKAKRPRLHTSQAPQLAWKVKNETAMAEQTEAIRQRGSLLPPAA